MFGIPLLMMAATVGASPYETVSLRCAVAVTKVFAHISIHSEDAKGQPVQGVPITERISRGRLRSVAPRSGADFRLPDRQ